MTVSTKIGFGPKVSAPITVVERLDAGCAGKIVISLSFVGMEFLEKAGLVGVAGVVVPALHWRDFEYARKLAEFPLLVLVRFGRLDLQKDLTEKLGKLDGKKGVIDGEKHELATD